MKKLIYILLFMMLSQACKRADDLFKSYGEETTEVRQVADFDKILAGEKFDIELVQDSSKAGTVEMTAGKNVISGYTSKVINGELQLLNENKFNWVRKLKVRQKVVVYFKTLNQLQINGSAKFSCRDSLYNPNTLTINHGGLEDANIKIKSDYIFVQCTNTGGVYLSGTCFLISISVDDISFVNALNLASEKCYITSFSRDDSYINALKVIHVRLFGNGNIFYKSTPTDEFEIEDAGVGEVKIY